MDYKFYNQNDYPHIPYVYDNPKSSVASSGCGLCSCCMVVENLMGKPFTPAEAVKVALDCGARDDTGTEISILAPAVCDKFGMTCEFTNDAGRVLQFLQKGEGMVIANSGGDREGWTGVFTHGGHFIVLAAAQGRKITVLDPAVKPGKFDEPGRAGKVVLEGSIAYTDIAVLAKDCDNRTPAYVLFRKK